MALLQIIILALVQGITEFLPISSSAHLVLVPLVADWPDQGPLIDVAVHVGTLGAVMVYFRGDVVAMCKGGMALLRLRRAGSEEVHGERLAGYILIATIPVVAAGLLLSIMDGQDLLRSVPVIGWTTLIFGVALYYADQKSAMFRKLENMKWSSALIIGLAQVLALVPGTSRSGITMTAARMLGFSRRESAHFSMLLSIPTILAAGTLAGVELYRSGNVALGLDAVAAAVLAFVTALLVIAVLMRWLRRSSFTPFVVYRVILGLALLWWAYA